MAKEDIKELILSKAHELIREKGGFTIKELTDATHVNIAAVNYHFGSKDNLTKVIISDVVNNLKKVLTYYIIRLETGIKMDEFMAELVNIVYDFTVENTGIIRYLFLSLDNQLLTTNELVHAFFSENEFTTVVYGHLAKLIGSENPKEIAARYMIFFAAGAAPMFAQLMQNKQDVKATFNDEEFKRIYVAQMMKLLN